MRISVHASSVQEALSYIENPIVGGVVLSSSACGSESHHQFEELTIATRERSQRVYLQWSDTLDGNTSKNQLEQALTFWNRSIYLTVVFPYSQQSLRLATSAKQRGLPLHLSHITTLAQLHNTHDAGATGGWLPLQQLDQRLERSSEDLLNRGRAVIDQHGSNFELVAFELTDADHLAYALEYGADAAVVTPELLS